MELGIWTFATALVSFAIAAISGRYLVPFLHKLKYGQTILYIGPSWHKNKQGTPTMGTHRQQLELSKCADSLYR